MVSCAIRFGIGDLEALYLNVSNQNHSLLPDINSMAKQQIGGVH